MLRVILVALVVLLPLPLALGTSAVDITSADRIEEDWEVVIATPDSRVTCPQISTAMKVDLDDSSPVMIFNLNYCDSPTFSAGGVQAKIVSGNQTLANSTQGSAQFQTNDETVTWTQRLSLVGGNLNFKIASGQSTTWGPFGVSDNDLSVSTASALTSFANYSPDTSVLGSGPGFGSNRVTRMTLLRVRYYQGQTLLSTDATPRPVNITQ